MEANSNKDQDARAYFRKEFLRSLTQLSGKDAEIFMHDKTRVRAKFMASDKESDQFYVTGLQTPIGVHPHALLRSGDILRISFPQC